MEASAKIIAITAGSRVPRLSYHHFFFWGGGSLFDGEPPKFLGGVTSNLPQNLVWGRGLIPKFGDLPQKSGWGRLPFWQRVTPLPRVVWSGARKNEPFVRKRSWRILSVKGRTSVKLALRRRPERQNIDIHLNRRTPQSVTDKIVSSSSKWRVSFLHTSKSDGRRKIHMRKLASLLSDQLMYLEYL